MIFWDIKVLYFDFVYILEFSVWDEYLLIQPPQPHIIREHFLNRVQQVLSQSFPPPRLIALNPLKPN